jgi:hypothetical protein
MGVRVVAVVMILGGIVGVVSAVRVMNYYARLPDFSQLVVPCCSMLLFAWTAIVGRGLWLGKARFIRWAMVLFGMQGIVLGIGGYAYEFSTGLSVRILVEGSMMAVPTPSRTLSVGANLGSSFNLHLTREHARWMVGINLVALIILSYLSHIYRRISGVSPAPQAEAKAPVENPAET